MLERIFFYLPKFIIRNQLLEDLLGAIAGAMLNLKYYILSLRESKWTPNGLYLTAKERGIIVNGYESTSALQDKIKASLSRAIQRGTFDGIKADLADFLVCDQSDVDLVYTGMAVSGIIVDRTYIGVDDTCAVDFNKVLTATVSNIGVAFYDTNKIKRKSIPVECHFIIKEA